MHMLGSIRIILERKTIEETLLVIPTQSGFEERQMKGFQVFLLLNSLVLVFFITCSPNLSSFSSVNDNDDGPSSSSARARTFLQEKLSTELPDWRISTRCSVFSVDCMAHAQRQNVFEEYPFRFGSRLKELDGIAQYQDMTQIPKDWMNFLASVPKNAGSSSNYVYPPEASVENFRTCLADNEQLSWPKQIEKLMSTVKVDAQTGMVAFTLSDWNYAHDMSHDVFEMATNTVDFPGSFFVVALDKQTTEIACRYNYPVVSWTAGFSKESEALDAESLKAAIGNAKFEISHELVRQGYSFFFFEMDVWFLRSPKSILLRFLESDHDVIFSSHQNDPIGPNIGAYAVKAKSSTEEYFRLSIKMANDSPNTHDQIVMGDVAFFFHHTKMKQKHEWDIRWSEPKPSSLPELKSPFTFGFFTPHHFAADKYPIITEQTVAIHTLCGAPLRTPHGKKMVAKERGAWYGFDGPKGEGGYYSRKGEKRRYLWVDGHVLNGFSLDMQFGFDADSGLHHNDEALKWTVATMVALARRTNRIFVLPKVLYDHFVQFLWTRLDLKSVEELGVEVRETSFPMNPKAWYSATEPFRNVARTALGHDGVLFAQYPADNITRAWRLNLADNSSQVDAFYAIHGSHEIDPAELLLVNARYIDRTYVDRMLAFSRTGSNDIMSLAEQEIVEAYTKLRWCKVGLWDSVERTYAEHDCYGSGEESTNSHRYDRFYWEDLPEYVRSAAVILGYDKGIWNSDRDPDSFSKRWDDLTDEAKAAANVVGYNKGNW